MKDSEKVLIKNLFHKLKNIEQTVFERDEEAENMINVLLSNQKKSPYYMVQTILMQEIAIQELNNKIKFLEKQNVQNNTKKTGFLSRLLRKQVLNPNQSYNQQTENSTSKNYDSRLNKQDFPEYNINKSNQNGRISSFLGNALQTAAGVAGGMVAGNILTNLFNHKEENNMLNNSSEVSHTYLEKENIDELNNDHHEGGDLLQNNSLDDNNFEYVDYEDNDLDNINYD